ncbi:MAG: hypothetical protein HYX33_00590 [Actinobacteria bacterium]|nr:hypothetical protein [Actinomycetota bacterium]
MGVVQGPTGDGLAVGVQLLGALAARGELLEDAARVMERLPQRLVNIRVSRKHELSSATAVWAIVDECERALGDDGRVVVRPSGTEPLVRVMVEAADEADCDRWCDAIAAVVRDTLGGND